MSVDLVPVPGAACRFLVGLTRGRFPGDRVTGPGDRSACRMTGAAWCSGDRAPGGRLPGDLVPVRSCAVLCGFRGAACRVLVYFEGLGFGVEWA